MSVFDNAAREPEVAARGESRGLLLRVDEQTHTASLVQSDASPQHQLSYSQGDMQALPNGDWFAGWGSVGEYTEFAPDGAMLSDANIRAGMASYRALKFQWIGTPTDPPRIAVTRAGPLLRIAASWNGATNVARWQVLVGPDPHSLHADGTFDRIGFETAMRAPDAHAGVVEVRALDAAGRTLGTSAPRALH